MVSKILLGSKKSVTANSPLSRLLAICSIKSTKQPVVFFPGPKPYWLGTKTSWIEIWNINLLSTHFSKILLNVGSTEVGRWLVQSMWDPSLKTDTTSAILILSGNLPWINDRFIICVKGLTISKAPTQITEKDGPYLYQTIFFRRGFLVTETPQLYWFEWI